MSFDFFGLKPPIISAKRLTQTAEKGAKKLLFFLKPEAPVAGYFGEKTYEIFLPAKKGLYFGKLTKKILIRNDFFAALKQKITITG